MPDYDAPDLAAFITAVRERGLTTTVIAWQEEYNQVPGEDTVMYDHIAHFTLLAYHRPSSSIIRCQLKGDKAERALISTQLADAGFQVEQRTRNEIKYRTKH